VDANFFPAIKRFMKLTSFRGLVGGKPNFAYFFVGMVENPLESKQKSLDRLIYLDPHLVRKQNATNCTTQPRSIHMSQLDPCMSFGFLIRSEKELAEFGKQLFEGIQQDKPYQIFHIVDDDADDLEGSKSIISFGTIYQ
jgi:hypothetical protein